MANAKKPEVETAREITNPADQLDQDRTLREIVRDAIALDKKAEDIQIQNEEGQAGALAIIKEARSFIDIIEEKRKFFSVPLNNILSSLNEKARILKDPINRIIQKVNGKLIEYKRKADEAARKEREKLQKKIERAAENGKPIPVQPQINVPKTVRADAGTLSYKKVWRYEIINEQEVPREYLMLDTSKIQKVINAGVRSIPGLRIFEDIGTSFRR